jgi:pantoate--beta-alanine ligase
MLTVRTEDDLRAELALWSARGKTVGFVPTMGALHEGHLSLVRLARARTDLVVVSVFVNPAQFGPGEDFERYPRQPERDAELLEGAGCELLFLPDVETIYPPGHTTHVDPGGPAEGLEGAFRPGHFRGVATVVVSLLELVRPEVAVFGEKDAQQLAVVRRVVRDLHLPVEIVAGPTVREPDGLALSSRNVYLSPLERRAAAVLHRALQGAARAIEAGEWRAGRVRRLMAETLAGEPLARVEYAEVVDAESFRPLEDREQLAGRVVLPLAVRIGATRLIDNLHLTVGPALDPEAEAELSTIDSRAGGASPAEVTLAMQRTLLKSKIHRATVTGADLDYQGSVTVDPLLMEAADLLPWERVEIYNINNGERFATYAIPGRPGAGEIVINGAAARKAARGDLVILATYATYPEEAVRSHRPRLVFVDQKNRRVLGEAAAPAAGPREDVLADVERAGVLAEEVPAALW